ncbi:acyl-CoA dehydrogenase [Mycobacterium triplex]|uniref:glutaryl-CoA dehydrogenase (ETF) n=2 Tax=Mycobacterium triplex TaxID=47839 RepID=A0ABX3VVS6_9MYCO|nr:acyl-CoA dehydrogenase family protein [Mycobacterium triplex]ORW99098.1 acyl-CoA dehydrogenase [Mycobacterium triplex]
MMPASFAPLDYLSVDSSLTDVERDIRDAVRVFVRDRILPYVGEWFEQARLPVEIVRELGKLGILGMHLDGYGCAGTSATAYGLACLELEAGDSGIRSLVSVQGSLAMFAIHRWGSEEQKLEWLPRMAAGEAVGCFGLTEPDSGSDPGAMRTSARRDGPDWILRGRKMWITNGSIAEVAVVWARTDEGVRGFLVPKGTNGFRAQDIRKKLSLRASITSELILDDVRLPASAMLPGATSLRGPLACLNEARYGIVWGAAGAARACLEAALDYSTTRVQFGKPIASFQIQQQKLAAMALEVNRATVLAVHLGRLKDAGRLRPEQVSMGKLGNVNAALDVARAARQMLGANGISLEYPVIRHLANLESVVTYEGTADVHTLVIGGALTGIDAFR